MKHRITRILNHEIDHSHKERCITNAELKMFTDILDELGFKWKHLDADRVQSSHLYIDVFSDMGPRLFTDDNGHKFLIPNYIRGREVGNCICTIHMSYSWQREIEDDQPLSDFKPHVSVDYTLKGAHWEYGRKKNVIVCARPSGMTWVYTYGTIEDNIDTIRESLTALKNHLINGEPFPKPKKK